MYNKKYRKDYGQMVICADSRNVWRYKEFEYYKHQRKLDRKKREVVAEQNGQNWTDIFELMDDLLQDIRENFPWKVVKVDECEGDDIIGALACRTQDFGKYEPVMIISTDGDFKQLQKFDNVAQFAPMQKKLVVEKNPRKYQLEHICRGDKGDGIPNIKSSDDLFTIDGSRQTPIMKKEINLWFDNVDNLKSVMTEDQYRNFQRNKLLIDLESIPEGIYNSIIETYDGHKPANKMKVLNYLIKKRLRNLVECTEDFYNG
tara:strand:- start:14819 stop:15595 length:777 start_codon:yes stop_codon:yes gene_type:complete